LISRLKKTSSWLFCLVIEIVTGFSDWKEILGLRLTSIASGTGDAISG